MRRAHVRTAATLALAATTALSACKKEEAPAEVAAPSRPSGPVAPRWSVSDLQMDARVQFPDRAKPNSEELAQAVADFASALVTGDADAFGGLLSSDGKAVLSALTASGDWSPATKDLRAVRVCRIDDEASGTPVLALGIEDDFGATLLAWRIEQQGGSYAFAPMPIDPPIAERVAMLDDAPLEAPTFSAGGAAEAPIVVNLPDEPEDNKKKNRGKSPGPSRRPAPSGPSPEELPH